MPRPPSTLFSLIAQSSSPILSLLSVGQGFAKSYSLTLLCKGFQSHQNVNFTAFTGNPVNKAVLFRSTSCWVLSSTWKQRVRLAVVGSGEVVSARKKERWVPLETKTGWNIFFFLELTDRRLQEVDSAGRYTWHYYVLVIAGGVKHRLSQWPISVLG